MVLTGPRRGRVQVRSPVFRLLPSSLTGGDYKTGRYNEGKRDLNRDFPTYREVNLTRQELEEGRQPETKAMIDLILTHPWVLSANFHDGAVIFWPVFLPPDAGSCLLPL